MSLIKRRRDSTVQIYLRLTNKQFYLGTEDRIDPDRVYNALSYLWEKITIRRERDLEYYERVGQMLESLLPEEERRRLPEAPQITGEPKISPNEIKRITETFEKILPIEISKLAMSGEFFELAGKIPRNLLQKLMEGEKKVGRKGRKKS